MGIIKEKHKYKDKETEKIIKGGDAGFGVGNTDNTNLNDPKILSNINNAPVFFTLGIVILTFIIIIFCIIFKVPAPKSGNVSLASTNTIGYTFLFLMFLFLILLGSVTYLPILKDFKNFLLQIKNVTYVVIYTILLILFFQLTPKNILEQYSTVFTITTILLTVFMFYKAFEHNYVEEFNTNYERIKMVILFFCLITIIIMYYINDPGGYINKYFGYSLILTILIFVFLFLYVIILLTLPDNLKATGESGEKFSLLKNFTKFSVWGSISFIIFLIIITVYLSKFSDKFAPNISNTFDFSENKLVLVCVLVMVLIVCILWGTLLVINLFPELEKNSTAQIDKFNIFKRGLLILFGLIISGLLIGFITYNVQHFSGGSTITSILLNILLIVVLLSLIYKIIVVKIPYGNSRKNAFFSLLFNIIFYIPCLFTDAFDFIMKLFIHEYNATTTGSVLLLLFAIGLIALYFIAPQIFNKINLQGGKLLVNQPVYTNSNFSLGTYQELNGNKNKNEEDLFDYQYAISFWFFLDANAQSSQKYSSILNFGEKPNILYNNEKNTLIVTMPNDVQIKSNKTNKTNKSNSNKTNKYGNKTEEDMNDDTINNSTILYKNKDILLQKWNNMIINYNGGTLDIFLNGELVKSLPGVVPYYKLDNLTIGDANGVNGGICNVVYFNKTLTSTNIYYLYNMVKNFSPPIVEDNNYTIIKEKLTSTHNKL